MKNINYESKLLLHLRILLSGIFKKLCNLHRALGSSLLAHAINCACTLGSKRFSDNKNNGS